MPHSTGNGTTERDQHLGPRAVRNVSAGLRRAHLDFQFNPWEKKRIYDLGDVPLPEANDNEKCIERITSYYSKISSFYRKNTLLLPLFQDQQCHIVSLASRSLLNLLKVIFRADLHLNFFPLIPC